MSDDREPFAWDYAGGLTPLPTPALDMAALRALYASLPAPPPPIPMTYNPSLRARLAEHLRTELKRRTIPPITPGGMGFGLSEFDIADLAIAFLRPCACYPDAADHEDDCPQHTPTEEPTP